MTRRKCVCLKWTLVILLVLVYPSVYSRPQETIGNSSNSDQSEISAQTLSPFSAKATTSSPVQPIQYANPAPESSGRDIKSKPIKQSIEMVAIQLMDKPNSTVEAPVLAVSDTRIPPKLKTQVKHRIKTRNEDGEQPENAHRGEAVPVTMEELETENKITEVSSESSTSNAGISTWVSLGHSVKESTTTEASKTEDASKKPKPNKNKPKRPQNNKGSKRPIIGSTNKSDLVAGGSAINENVYNQIKDTVLTNVQKNKNTRPTTTSTTPVTTTTTTTESPTTKLEIKAPVVPVVTITSKPKKKNKNKPKTSTTAMPIIDDSALLPTEAKGQEIELEISTPATTTKKPKRKSTKKKNKTKKRKTSKPSTEVAVADVKTSNKTKSNKHTKKPAVETSALTTQIYNYLSREVMPSVGVGVLGLASLVGLAGYFLYPFATPVRRTFEVDKSDDIYRNNAEEYANDGNGQAEEEMLGTVLAGMPAHAKQKLNPYAGQTSYATRYPVKKEPEIRYKHATPAYSPNYKVHYAQQKTGIAHAAVYSKPFAYSPQQYETRHAYTTEGKHNYDNNKHPSYTPYSAAAVEPIYAAPQTGPSSVSSYGSDSNSYGSDSSNSYASDNSKSNSVVYGVKPSAESDFKPVYPYEGQYLSETTSSPVTYSPTSMYLGSNDNSDKQYDDDDTKYGEGSSGNFEDKNNKFVVGNVPKEFSDTATPAVVPEHGPRKLRKRRSISGSLEELLAEKELNKDIFISNEIDDVYHTPIRNLAPFEQNDVNVIPKDVTTVYAVSEPVKDTKTFETSTIDKLEIVESVSTMPIGNKDEKTTETEMPVELETTTKSFKIYEVFPSSNMNDEKSSSLFAETTTFKSIMTETTTELKSETTSVMPTAEVSTIKPTLSSTTSNPDAITYPPVNDGGFLTFIQRLIDFKFRLGLGILQTTVDALNKFKNETMQKVVKASQT